MLDEATQGLTYPGWEEDVRAAEANWADGVSTAEKFKWTVGKMRRTQRLHEGDRSDALLQVLDEATQGLTYPGWERDVRAAESTWTDGVSTAEKFKRTVERMRRKQRLHEGDRSDALLQVLDGATQGLTYPGWERDVRVAEANSIVGFSSANELKRTVERMRRTQRLHEGDRSDALLQVLDEATQGLTYPGREHDVRVAELNWIYGFSSANELKRTVERMRRKQRLHEGDRSDALLQVLDGATQGLTYPGWERDVQAAELNWIFGFSSAKELKRTVERMRRKQRLHDCRL